MTTAIRVIIEFAPYFAIAALAIAVITIWIFKADACRRSSKNSSYPKFVSAEFLVFLLIILFGTFLLIATKTIAEGVRAREEIRSQQALLKDSMAKKSGLEKEAAKLKGQVRELEAQKALYTATIETLSKK